MTNDPLTPRMKTEKELNLVGVAFEWDCEGPSKPEISNLEKTFFLVNEKILWLQIPVFCGISELDEMVSLP